ncbi:MAG: mannosylglucosylglycerate synthase, partial [Patescibacteria group bacterium]|nr:mannosylglucosylglycerate synthase [Patescibacteria group bacterium]
MKIGIFHYKIASTDGVSLEIEKRINILESLGHTVVVVGGKFDKTIPQKSYILKDFDIDDEINRTLVNQTIKDEKIEQIAFQKTFNERKELVEIELDKIFEAEKFDLIIVHNIFSLPLLLWCAYALKKTIEKFNVNTVCVNHDFYFERDYFINSSNADLPKILEDIFPTPSEVRHEVINTIASKRLYEIHKISSTVLGDYLDFSHTKTGIDDFNSDFLLQFGIEENDLVVLQATRIVPRKAIEMSILLTAYINKRLPHFIDQTLNG